MQIRAVIAISVASLVVGYSLAIVQRNRGCSNSPAVIGAKNEESGLTAGKTIYELDEVGANRDSLDGKIISVVGGVTAKAGRPLLVPDDDVALVMESPVKGGYSLSLPDWHLDSPEGVCANVVVTGRFGKLDDIFGYDCLSPISSISWDLPPRGEKHDAIIDAEEQKILEAVQSGAEQRSLHPESKPGGAGSPTHSEAGSQ